MSKGMNKDLHCLTDNPPTHPSSPKATKPKQEASRNWKEVKGRGNKATDTVGRDIVREQQKVKRRVESIHTPIVDWEHSVAFKVALQNETDYNSTSRLRFKES